MTRDRLALFATVLVVIIGCVFIGWPYAMTRIVHVDEFTNLYSSRLLDAYRSSNASDSVEMFQVVSGWLTRGLETTFEMIVRLRALFFATFVAGLCLVPFGLPGVRPEARGVLLLLAFLFVPLWRHGIEIRHDPLLGFGLAALFVVTDRARVAQLPAWANAIAGAVAVMMQLNAHKGFVLSLPALALLLFVTHRRGGNVRATFVQIAAGGLAMLLSTYAVYAAQGHLERYLHKFVAFSEAALAANRFSPLPTLTYLLRNSPVQVALALFALIVAAPRIWRRRLDALTLGVAFFLIALVAFLANPNPYPYNMSWLGFGILAGAVQGFVALAEFAAKRGLSFTPVAITIAALIAITATFAWRNDRFLATDFDGQRNLITAAENLTAPDQPILDVGGLVATRPPASRDWLVHSLLMRDYLAGRRESIVAMADKTAPPVLIRYYRWSWLPAAQVAELEKTYVPVSDQLWVLGCRSQGSCRLRRTGRYLVNSEFDLSIDGTSQPDGAIIELTAGEHQLVTTGAVQLAWLGPHATQLPVVPKFEPLFQGNEL